MIFFFMVTMPVTFLHGQTRHPLIEYSTENGLSLNSVNELKFDNQGFLWVATADGLQRFDGYRFQTFKHDPLDKKSISENSISTIYEDQNNNLWITHRTGICFKPKGRNEFIDITSAIHDLPLKFALTIVNETDSSVWILNYPFGVFAINKFSLQAKQMYSLPGFTDQVLIYPISRLFTKGDRMWFKKRLDKGGDLYMLSDNGLKQFKNNMKLKVFFLIQQPKDSLVIVSDKWVYKALTNDPFTPVRILRAGFDSTIFDHELMFLPRKISNDQYLLLGGKKIMFYDAIKEEILPFPSNEYFSSDLTRYLHTATADPHQNSWLGFNGIGGIKVISLQKFNLFSRPVKDALTYSLTADEKGNVYAGIYLGDIEVYDKDGKFIKTIKLPGQDKRSGSPRAMAMIDSVTLVVRSTLTEIYAIDTRTGKLQRLSHMLPPRPDSLNIDFESGIQAINKNEVWLSYSSSILSLKKNADGFSLTTICSLSPREYILTFHHTSPGQTWIGTVNCIWLYENNKLEKIQMPVTYIKHINQRPDGRIWAATTNGLLIIENKKIIKHLNVKDGLPNSFVYSVLFDEDNNAWISTNRGIAKIVPPPSPGDSSYLITSYSAKEGLQGDEFNTKGYYKAPDGTLYFAGVNGINFFKPKNLVSKSGPSQTMLTKIDVNNLPYLPNLQPEFINTINLKHQQNNISLSFSCMDFTVPEKNQYKFWLKGFQADWSLQQNNNTVQYILPVGEYELHVLGANYEGVWSKEPLILRINILPPWYLTTWARFLFAIFILGSVAAIFYFISRNRYKKKLRQLQMEQEVQKEKQRLSRDLHDNLGSQITWLSNNITQLERAEEEKQPVEKKLSQLKEGTGELMQTLRETIWILNKDKISCVDLFDKVVSLAARHVEVCPPMQLNTEENISSNIELNSGQALQIFRICQEAINNACKHSQATLLSVKADSSNDHFTISVSDNGKGFDPSSENPGHYGLQNMKERAKESNLGLKIESSPTTGTIVTVSLS